MTVLFAVLPKGGMVKFVNVASNSAYVVPLTPASRECQLSVYAVSSARADLALDPVDVQWEDEVVLDCNAPISEGT